MVRNVSLIPKSASVFLLSWSSHESLLLDHMQTEEHMVAIIAVGCEKIQKSSGNDERVRQIMALCCNAFHEVSGHHWGKVIKNNTTKMR